MDQACERCGSHKIIPLASVQDQGQYSDGNLKALIVRNPEAWVFKGPVYASLKARICGECGHTELVAEGAEKLWEAYCKVQREGAEAQP